MTTTTASLQIAIDGPVASGKGEIASRLARRLNLLYIYTGAMYRALALACLNENISCKDGPRVVALLSHHVIEITNPSNTSEKPFTLLLDGKDVTQRIFTADVAQGASDVGTIQEVRTWMVKRQQELALGKRVVMEGRDIALRVLPNAHLKIYLTADIHERARRRLAQFAQMGITKTLPEVMEDIRVRDAQDETRSVDPLQKMPDSWELDTTGLSKEEVVEEIVHKLQERQLI